MSDMTRVNLDPLRILVTGSRTWTQPFAVISILDSIYAQKHPSHKMIVVHGDCPSGADRIAKNWCLNMCVVDVADEAHPVSWGTGRRGGPLRNAHMVNLGADVCLAFVRDGSAGASGCARFAREAGIPTVEFGWDQVDLPAVLLDYDYTDLSWSFRIE